MVRAALYLRISQDPKRDGLAVERQREDCERLAADRGWKIVETYSDTVSAFNARKIRPAYSRMLDDYRAGRFDALVVWDLDRLTRQPRQLEDWIDLAEQRGLKLVTASGEADLTTDNGRLFARIKASVARAEQERKSVRQRRANLQAVSKGKPVPSRRRFGFESDGVTPREEEAAIVRRVFQHVADGGALKPLAAALNAEGVPAGRATEWNARRLRAMTHVVAYGGQVEHLGTVTDSDVVPQIVPREQAIAVRQILADPARKVSPGNAPRHLMSGIAICGVCGDVMNFGRDYRCRKSLGGHTAIRKDRLEKAVAAEVAWAWLTEDDGNGPESTEIAGLLSESAALSEQRTAATEALFVPGVDVSRIKRQLAELDARSTELEAQIISARGAMVSADLITEARRMWRDDSAENATEAGFYVFWDALPLERQREIVRGMFTVTVYPAFRQRGEDVDNRRTVIHRL